MKKAILMIFLTIFSISKSFSQKDTIHIFGPGGPYPAMREAADNFEKKINVKVNITKGPLKKWQSEAEKKADLIYSGSENMMSTFLSVFIENINSKTDYPLYYRKSGLLVRKGNPKKIKNIFDLQNSNLKIMVVNGAGLTGVWEDIFGKMKDLDAFRKIKANIKYYAEDSASAEKHWKENSDVDVWITWNIWQISNSDSADFISLKERYTIYRDFGIVLSKVGEKKEVVNLFYEYLKSKEAEKTFNKWGWK